MQTNYLYSVIIPTYNRAHIVTEAIDSVLVQNQQPIQIIVIDDGSTDNTAEKISQYGDKVEYYYQPNQGVSVARNNGLERVKGQFIAFLDSDDIWLPTKVATEQQIFNQFPQVEVLLSNAEAWSNNRLTTASRLDKTFKLLEKTMRLPSEQSAFTLPPQDPVWIDGGLCFSCCMTYRASSTNQFGLNRFDTLLDNFEDWDLQIRLLRAGHTMISPQKTCVIRRFNDGTRKGRYEPGVQETPQQTQERLKSRHRVLKKAQALNGWAADVSELLDHTISGLEQQIEQIIV